MSSSAPANRDDQIAQLAGLTGVAPAEVRRVEGPRIMKLLTNIQL